MQTLTRPNPSIPSTPSIPSRAKLHPRDRRKWVVCKQNPCGLRADTLLIPAVACSRYGAALCRTGQTSRTSRTDLVCRCNSAFTPRLAESGLFANFTFSPEIFRRRSQQRRHSDSKKVFHGTSMRHKGQKAESMNCIRQGKLFHSDCVHS